MRNHIEVKGARVNNLKNIDINIPHGQFVVIAGVSGSGKSSLAFDTLYAEGQRRYVESLSSYARQFLGRMNKPECDFIKGLPPAIAIEQRVISRNSRSTVGTSTEIYEYMRLLFARIGRTYSPVSGVEVKKHSTEDIIKQVMEFSEGTRFCVMAPLQMHEGRTLERQLQMELQQGFVRLFIKGQFVRIDELLEDKEALASVQPSDIFILIDRMSLDGSKDSISRLTDSAETALYEGNGHCRLTFQCEGFGRVIGIDERLVIPNSTLSVYEGCVQCWHGEKMKMWATTSPSSSPTWNFPIRRRTGCGMDCPPTRALTSTTRSRSTPSSPWCRKTSTRYNTA